MLSYDHLSDHSGFQHKFDHPLESRYSGTVSENLGGDTQGSYSRGTSGDGISVSSQSIELRPYEEFYENFSDDAVYTIVGLEGDYEAGI